VKAHQEALGKGDKIPPHLSHVIWMAEKLCAGWTWGPVKDGEKKEHPDLVPYDQLSIEARFKDYLFGAINEAYFQVKKLTP
jgi:hypothetical protein